MVLLTAAAQFVLLLFMKQKLNLALFLLVCLANATLFAGGTDIGPNSIVRQKDTDAYFVVATIKDGNAVVRPLLTEPLQAILHLQPRPSFMYPITTIRVENPMVVVQEDGVLPLRNLVRVVFDPGEGFRPMQDTDAQANAHALADFRKDWFTFLQFVGPLIVLKLPARL